MSGSDSQDTGRQSQTSSQRGNKIQANLPLRIEPKTQRVQRNATTVTVRSWVRSRMAYRALPQQSLWPPKIWHTRLLGAWMESQPRSQNNGQAATTSNFLRTRGSFASQIDQMDKERRHWSRWRRHQRKSLHVYNQCMQTVHPPKCICRGRTLRAGERK